MPGGYRKQATNIQQICFQPSFEAFQNPISTGYLMQSGQPTAQQLAEQPAFRIFSLDRCLLCSCAQRVKRGTEGATASKERKKEIDDSEQLACRQFSVLFNFSGNFACASARASTDQKAKASKQQLAFYLPVCIVCVPPKQSPKTRLRIFRGPRQQF